jgi:hypothetical protein
VVWVFIVARLVNKLRAFYVIQCQLLCLRELAADTNPNPDQFIPHLTMLLLWDPFWCYPSEEACVVEPLCLLPTACWLHAWLIVPSWRWRQEVPPTSDMWVEFPLTTRPYIPGSPLWEHQILHSLFSFWLTSTQTAATHAPCCVAQYPMATVCATHFSVKYSRICLTECNCAVSLVLIINNDFYHNKDAFFFFWK